jgi:PAS domain S-box-containing protein
MTPSYSSVKSLKMSEICKCPPIASPDPEHDSAEALPLPSRSAGDARTEAVRRTGLLDTSPEEVFDRITRIASKLLGTSVSLISLVDTDRQFFKSQQGLPEPWATRRETPLSHSFCQHVIMSARPLVVEDARRDPRVADNRAVPELGVIAYLGVPLIDPDGHALGALCAIGDQPRAWTAEDEAALTDLSHIVMSEIALRRELGERQRAEAELRQTEERYRLVARATNDALWDWDLASDHILWNEAVQTLFGYRPEEVGPSGRWWKERIHPDDRERVVRGIHSCIDGGREHWTEEYRFQCADGTFANVFDRGYVIYGPNGKPCRMVGAMLDLTARKRAEEALRLGEERLRLALDSADIGTWDFNPVSGELQWGDRCKALFGLPPDAEVSYDVFLAALHPDDRTRTDAAVQHALDPGGPGAFEAEYRTLGLQDGVERWIAAKGRAVFVDRKAVRFIGTVLDIGARKRAEEVNARLAAIVSSSGDAIISFAPDDGRIQSWNRGAQDLFGYTEAEALGAPVGLLLPPEQHEGPTGVFDRVFQEGNIRIETVRVHKSGERIDVSIAASLMQAPDGRILGVSGVFRDIRERKQAETLMREAIEHQQLLNREVSHRVKNNLAMVASLLNLQIRTASDPAVKNALVDARAYHHDGRGARPPLAPKGSPAYRSRRAFG